MESGERCCEKRKSWKGMQSMKDTTERTEEKKSYLDAAKECLRMLDADSSSKESQKQVCLTLKNHFDENMAGRNRRLLQGRDLEEYLQIVSACLKQMPNDQLRTGESVAKEYRLPYTIWSAFMRLKYESGAADFFIKDGRLFCHEEGLNQTPGFLPVVLVELMEAWRGQKRTETADCSKRELQQIGNADERKKVSGQNMALEGQQKAVNDGNGAYLRIDAAIDRFLLQEGMKFRVLLNGKEIPYETSPRLASRSFFGQTITERLAFVLQIPLQKKIHLQFELEDAVGSRMTVPMVAIDYQAKLTTVLWQAYWCFGPYMAVFSGKKGDCKEALVVTKAGRFARIKRELKLLKEILKAPYGSRRMFTLRCLYWLSYPVYGRKKIWVTFDKLYKGGDCGEYFYKFLKKEGKGITPVYVLKKNAADWKRLEAEGYAPSQYGSTKQRLQYLHADMVFATHSSVHSFCGLSKWEVRFVQDRIKSVNTCIQHGLSVQDLTFDSNRIVNNNKRYYCASRYEVENLSKPAYDYAPDVLRLTGIPRYDGLVNRDKKQILITPTWRAYIAMPSVMGESRPYNPEFKNTDYYRIFQSLLENQKLSETAARTGYKIVYLLHPVISSQKEDFRPANDIEIVSAVDVNYEKILTESSLMVTDYSGVQFDFAYMRKPVVYFHPPKLPPHYVEGGFFYDTQGFGEICQEKEELVDVLCEYMESGCQLKEFYRGRQDDFFAFDDLESCRRIYEDALEFRKEHDGFSV